MCDHRAVESVAYSGKGRRALNPAHKRRVAIITALIYAAIIAACFLIARWVIGGLGERAVALVHDGDGAVHELPLDEDAELRVETSLGVNVIVVEDCAVRMAEADCPHGDCLRQHAISQPGEQIICLPHELWIEIAGDDADAGEMDTDAVVYDDDVDTVAR